jgi:hypothetical protein
MQRSGHEPFFREQISQASHTAHRLRVATMVSGPVVVRDWSYVSDEVVGDGFILSGDAACFVDPLFSSGVHLALSSGILAAAYVHTALDHPEMREPAGKVYKELYYRQYGHFRELAKLFYSSNRSVDSYFWEARRILGADESESPRHSFIQAVAGQPVQGYERAVLERGDVPRGFAEGVRAIESERELRCSHVDAALIDSADVEILRRLVPQLEPGAKLERKPVLGDGEFVWGYTLATGGNPEGLPVSTLVASAVALIDGQRSVADLITELSRGFAGVEREKLAAAVVPALRILYVDGAIVEMDGM